MEKRNSIQIIKVSFSLREFWVVSLSILIRGLSSISLDYSERRKPNTSLVINLNDNRLYLAIRETFLNLTFFNRSNKVFQQANLSRTNRLLRNLISFKNPKRFWSCSMLTLWSKVLEWILFTEQLNAATTR